MNAKFDRELMFLVKFINHEIPSDYEFTREKIASDLGFDARDGWVYQSKIFDELVEIGALVVVRTVTRSKGLKIIYRLKNKEKMRDYLIEKIKQIKCLNELLKAGRLEKVIPWW
ncbi:MAG: hypothetical protein QXG39_00205 [Candidatus Aenigmatarchaeota archaeon]